MITMLRIVRRHLAVAPVGAILLICTMLGFASAARAGGGGFGADDADDSKDAGPPFFGVVQDKDGKVVPDAKITVTIAKSNSTLVLHADSQGHFFVRGFDKSIDPKDVALACGKDGYHTAAGVKAPSTGASTPIEVTCVLEHE